MSEETIKAENLPLPNNIFLLGKMAVGKDFAGKSLVEQRGFTRIAFADPLKEDVAKICGVTVDEINSNKTIYREKLQEHGHNMRSQNPAYWIDRWVDARRRVDGPVVCTDCRHVNEAMFAISQPDSVVVKLELAYHTLNFRRNKLFGNVSNSLHFHPSEAEVDLCPFNIIIPGALSPTKIPNVIAKQLVGWREMGEPVLQLDKKTSLQFRAI